MNLKYVGFVTLIMSATVSAETAYVTDNLRLGLHRAADTSDRSFRSLQSGQEIEILSRDRNYAHVRLPNGVEGYVKAGYLVFEKPAKLIVAETQAKVEQLEQDLAATKQAYAEPAATIAALNQQLEQTRAELATAGKAVTDLSSANDQYKTRHEQFKYSLPLSWVGGAMFVCLLTGFLAGLWWFDRESRKRHGGIRIY